MDEKFVTDSFAELTELEIQKLDGDERIRKAISAPDENFGMVNYGGVDIKIKLFLPKSVRHKMVKTNTALEGANTEETLAISERTMYELLGMVCIDEPWNKWQTWAYIDEKSNNVGGVQSIFIQVLARIAQAAEDVKNFRRK
jgi:hypothetical protein